MNIKDIKIFLEKYYSELSNLDDLSEIILTIDENFKNHKISLLNLSNNLKINDILNYFFDIKIYYNINNNQNYIIDSLKLQHKKIKFDIVYIDSNVFSNDILNYFLLSNSISKDNSLFIFKGKNIETIKDLIEMLKLSKYFTHIIDLSNSSIFIKKKNFRMITYEELSNFSIKNSGVKPNKETIENTMLLINGFNRTIIKDDLSIEFLSFIEMKNVTCKILNKDNIIIYETILNLTNDINYWFSPSNKDYLNGFYLILMKNNYIFYKRFFDVKNNKVISEKNNII